MTEKQHACLECGLTSDQIPLLRLEFKSQEYWICPQHLPLLIHKPWILADKLPGIEKVSPAQED